MATKLSSLINIMKVRGNSMLPNMPDGTYIVSSKLPYLMHGPVEGDLVIARHPTKNIKVVKKVALAEGDGLFLVGTNLNESTDSRKFGWVNKSSIIGKVVFTLQD